MKWLRVEDILESQTVSYSSFINNPEGAQNELSTKCDVINEICDEESYVFTSSFPDNDSCSRPVYAAQEALLPTILAIRLIAWWNGWDSVDQTTDLCSHNYKTTDAPYPIPPEFLPFPDISPKFNELGDLGD